MTETGNGVGRIKINGGDNLSFGSATIRLLVFTKIDKMGSTILLMSFIFVQATRWRCASFMSLPAIVSEIFGGQTTPSILVVGEGGHSETEKIVLPIKPKRLTEDLFQLDSHIGFSFLYFHPKHSLLVNMH